MPRFQTAGCGCGCKGYPDCRQDAIDIGRDLARRVFASRGNRTEVHLSEAELVAVIAMGIEQAKEGR